MKICSIKGCGKKHHAKNFCSYHYKAIYLAEKFANKTCSVPGCNNHVDPNFPTQMLCTKHGTRVRRNGSVDIRRKDRDIRSFAEVLVADENPLDFEIHNNNSFSEIARCYYGDFCHECGWNKGPCEAHHIIPRSKGGKSTLRNCVVLCPNCHSLEHRNARKRLSDARREEVANILGKIQECAFPPQGGRSEGR